MEPYRHRIDRLFEHWGRIVVRHPLKMLLGVLCFTAAFVIHLPGIGLESSNESYFHPNNPTLIDYKAFREQFGREDRLIVAVGSRAGLNRMFLERLKAFHAALEERVPFLSEVTSLVNVRDIRGDEEGLRVEPLLGTLPATEEGLDRLRGRIMDSPLYRNYLISADGRTVAVLVEALAFSPEEDGEDLIAGFGKAGEEFQPAHQDRIPLKPGENEAVLREVRKVVAEFDSPEFPLRLGGGPVFEAFFKEAMTRDLAVFLTLAFLTVGLLLFVLFHRLSGLLLPLLVVTLSLLSTLGLMAATGTRFTLPITILPSFILSVGVGDSVHILVIYFRRFDEMGEQAEAIAYSLGHSGLPVVMTTMTTAAGLFSFGTSGMAPIAHLGIFAGIGVLMALGYTLVLLPALLALWPMKQRGSHSIAEKRSGGLDRILEGFATLAIRHAWAIVVSSVLLVMLSLAGLSMLRWSQNFLAWLPPRLDVRTNTEFIDRELGGSIPLEIVIDTGDENGVQRPRVMQGLDALARSAMAYRTQQDEALIQKSYSVVEVVKETHRALHENREEFYDLPASRELIAQELLLFENGGGKDLEHLVDSQFRKARLTLIAPFRDAVDYVHFVESISQEAPSILGQGVKMVVTGTMTLFTQMLHQMMLSMTRSYLIAGGVITLMMMVLIGSIRLSVVTLVVNFLPILLVLGLVMGFSGIRLDISTLLLGSIALGLAVDDTIHFFHNFRRYYGEIPDTARAIRETLLSSGRAMLFTTLVLVAGFWLFMFATLQNNFNFGLLTGIVLILALAADFLLAPALLTLIGRTRAGRGIYARWCDTTSLRSSAPGEGIGDGDRK